LTCVKESSRLLGSSSGATVEFMIPEAGSYIMVDHHFANASQGAIGLIEAGAKAEEAEMERRDEQWITRFLKSPEQMFATDPAAKALLGKYKVPMPNQNLSDAEIRGYLKYFRFNDAAAPKPQAKK
jgi:nitrite reductase (NO-forming)